MILAPNARNGQTCPIWDGLKIDPRYPAEQNVVDDGSRFYSSRAGGPFLLMPTGAPLLDSDSLDDEQKSLTDRQKVNLSYWIYKHNLENRLFDELSNQVLQEPGRFVRWMKSHQDRVLQLDKAWVEGHRNSTPSAEDRMLMFLRELIRINDTGEPPRTSEEYSSEGELLLAAGGCRNGNDRKELENYTATQGWMVPAKSNLHYSTRINLGARLYVEQRTRELDESRQGFVAMSFAPSLAYVYEEGIAPAIRAAGYEPCLIKDKEFTGGVMDEIMAEIRKSRFVVADFTACKECTVDQPCKNDAPGGVYCEAGFALGLDKTVFLTCREPCAQTLHFRHRPSQPY